MKYRQRVLGLILVSPLCKAPSWSEWLCNKVMSNLLYYYGTCGVVKELLLKRHFSKEVRGNGQVPESDIVQECIRAKELFHAIDTMKSPPNKKFKPTTLEKWDPRLEPDVVVYNAWERALWVLQQLKQRGQQPSS